MTQKLDDPRPGEVRSWNVGEGQSGRLFLVTRVGVAPGAQWASTTQANACYYILDGAEDWHYIEAVKFGSRVVAVGPDEASETSESPQSSPGRASNGYHSGEGE